MKRVVLLAVLLAGCANENVIDMGDGNHTVTGESVRGSAGARANAVELATEFCEKYGAKPVVRSFQDGIELPHWISSIIFTCEH